jgi:hypothetical protein
MFRWNASNHNVDFLLQVITFLPGILCIDIRELNLQARAQHQEKRADVCKVLSSGADLAALLSPHSLAKPEFSGQQNRRDGKHLDSMIKHFRALLNNTQDITNHMAI